MNGVILIDKEQNFTSRDVVNKLCGILHTKKIGHTGTLDPIATGVLVICIGKYTKLVNTLTALDKEYIATIKLNIETDTLDITGNIINKNDYIPTIEQVKEVLNSFLGKSIQEVPKYSAKKVNGKKLYEYARNNINVDIPKNEIEIYDIELISFINDEITFKVRVSKGTYIRSLIRDITYKLNTLGTMKSLRRIKQGSFAIEDCNTLKDIENNNYKLLAISDLFDFPIIELSETEIKKVNNGNKLEKQVDNGKYFLKYNEEIIAIYESKENVLKPIIILEH